MGGKGKQTVGYRYYFGIHMGLCRGAIDELVEIKVGDRIAWTGSVVASEAVQINAPQLFGGDDREGGIVGPLDVMMGEPTQPVNADLAAMLGGLVPAFRGVCSLFFDGQISALNPYPKVWKMRCRRALKGWQNDAPWNPATAIIDMDSGAIKAMNPAHMVYQCLTDPSWGRGLPATKLNDAAFVAAAQQLFDEGFGLCLQWTRQDLIDNFVQGVLDHIGAALYDDRQTGLLTLKLVRDDYDPDLLPLYTPDSGLLSIEDDDSGSQAAALNQVIVRYTSPIDGQQGQVRVQNTASITALGAKSSRTIDYPGIPTSNLAARAAQRDLVAGSGILKRLKVRLDGRGAGVQPASVFRVSDPSRGIANIVLRAGRVDDTAPHEGVITVSAVEDVFSLAATSFVQGQGSNWVPPNLTPVPIAVSDVIEIAYRDLWLLTDPGTIESLPETAGFLGALAERPNGLSLGYDIATRVGAVGDYVTRTRGGFSPTAVLAADLEIGAAPASASMTDGVDLDQVAVGTAALIDGEILRVDTIDLGTGEVTFGRGCVDTVPAQHLAGARVWFYGESVGADTTEYSDTDSVEAKLLTATGSGVLDELQASVDSVVMAARQNRPYPPGDFRINGLAYPTAEIQQLSVTWTHRDRVLQADQLVDTSEASIGPEPGTSYTLRIYDGPILIREELGIEDPSYTYDQEEADGGPFDPIRVTLHAVRDGAESWQMHDWTVPRDPLWVPPQSEPPFETVSLLIGFEGADGSTSIVDESGYGHVITVNGDAQIDTGTALMGTSSGLFDGAGDYLTVPHDVVLNLSNVDFTIEFFAHFSSVATSQTFFGKWPGDINQNLGWVVDWRNTNQLRFLFSAGGTDGNIKQVSWAPTVGVTYHVAICRSGDDLRFFINGAQIGTLSMAGVTINASTADLFIGNLEGVTTYFNGLLDEMRVLKGFARYTAPFTPPSAPFPRS